MQFRPAREGPGDYDPTTWYTARHSLCHSMTSGSLSQLIFLRFRDSLSPLGDSCNARCCRGRVFFSADEGARVDLQKPFSAPSSANAARAVVELYVCRMRCVTMFFAFTGGAELRIILPHAKSVFVSKAGLGLASRAPFFPVDGLHQFSHTYRIEVYRSAMIRALILQRRTSC